MDGPILVSKQRIGRYGVESEKWAVEVLPAGWHARDMAVGTDGTEILRYHFWLPNWISSDEHIGWLLRGADETQWSLPIDTCMGPQGQPEFALDKMVEVLDAGYRPWF